MRGLIYSARVMLIRVGKVLPFLMCLAVAISYAESSISTASGWLVVWNGSVIPFKPISWPIGRYIEYNAMFVVVLAIISISIEACIYNKMACIYLAVNLIEKHLFQCIIIDEFLIYPISALNVAVAIYIVAKGIFINYKKR